MRTFIFAAGAANPDEPILISPNEDDIVIAADGGTHYCLLSGLSPDFVIGDLDSISPEDRLTVENSDTKIIEFPTRKDFTDLELALLHACQLGATEIRIFGGLGLRWDQTLANILLLASPSLTCRSIILVDGKQEIVLVTESSPVILTGNPGDIVSLIPISGDCEGITTSNLEYPLESDTLYFGASRGVSNSMTSNTATISLIKGLLICTIIHL